MTLRVTIPLSPSLNHAYPTNSKTGVPALEEQRTYCLPAPVYPDYPRGRESSAVYATSHRRRLPGASSLFC